MRMFPENKFIEDLLFKTRGMHDGLSYKEYRGSRNSEKKQRTYYQASETRLSQDFNAERGSKKKRNNKNRRKNPVKARSRGSGYFVVCAFKQKKKKNAQPHAENKPGKKETGPAGGKNVTHMRKKHKKQPQQKTRF